MRLLKLVSILIVASGCGDPSDRPEDCNPNEYFDDARKLCFTCRAITQPRCDDGCGVRILADERGCPEAECILGEQCTMCEPDEFVDETLRCAPCDGPMTCADDSAPTRRVEGNSCTLTCE